MDQQLLRCSTAETLLIRSYKYLQKHSLGYLPDLPLNLSASPETRQHQGRSSNREAGWTWGKGAIPAKARGDLAGFEHNYGVDVYLIFKNLGSIPKLWMLIVPGVVCIYSYVGIGQHLSSGFEPGVPKEL